jgi:hypothetical protein
LYLPAKGLAGQWKTLSQERPDPTKISARRQTEHTQKTKIAITAPSQKHRLSKSTQQTEIIFSQLRDTAIVNPILTKKHDMIMMQKPIPKPSIALMRLFCLPPATPAAARLSRPLEPASLATVAEQCNNKRIKYLF